MIYKKLKVGDYVIAPYPKNIFKNIPTPGTVFDIIKESYLIEFESGEIMFYKRKELKKIKKLNQNN